MENKFNKLPRATRRFKGKLPLKCFNYEKIGHFAAKFPIREDINRVIQRTYIPKRVYNETILLLKS